MIQELESLLEAKVVVVCDRGLRENPERGSAALS